MKGFVIIRTRICDANQSKRNGAQQLDKKILEFIYAKLCKVIVDSNLPKCGKFDDDSWLLRPC